MARIVVHAGTAKAGSSAIQAWMAEQDEHGPWTPVVARVSDHEVSVEPVATARSANSSPVIRTLVHGEDRAAAAFTAALDRAASTHGDVVLSGEALDQLFWRQVTPSLAGLEALARVHDVVVAYYVRPQHSSLEAAWRQWGFRSERSPTEFVRHRATQGTRYHYVRTIEHTARRHPGLRFVLRPFRRDLLDDGDVVVDFVRRFLGLDLAPDASARVNVGMSLDLINSLAVAGHDDPLWGDVHRNARFNAVKRLLADASDDVTEDAAAGRRVLQAWSYERWGEENAVLVDRMGWGPEPFVPPVEADPEITQLDRLWAPPAPPSVALALKLALVEAVGGAKGRSVGAARDLDTE